ncbi:hypothetical protein QLH51_04275 [Sphingomonas sp. 2R-10]|uniref:hypothetical protein n=1 Tax=Sphingomonas sp. 2R-10 TaxID=3045148 RepID=UPI0024B8B0F6|nr:hypothetical protein [Sphingomonas sp. 2R-10]MDJ0276020.1 hypothetical protein [Sphingomonas sp. 2R-10]
MGEARDRKIRAAGAHDRLTAGFVAAGVDPTAFGFYDQAAFLAQEQRDGSYLEKYAEWVATRPVDAVYEAHVRATVPKLASLVAAALTADDMQGGCMTAFSMLTRMLDRLGVWSFGVIGSANLDVPHLDLRRCLHTIDVRDHPDAVLGHAWVCAPPFFIVDASLALQHWAGTPMAGFVPPVVLGDAATAPIVRPGVDDCVSADVRAIHAEAERRLDPNLHHRLEPRLAAFGGRFPAREILLGQLSVRYVPIAIRQTNEPLEMVNAGSGKGRPAITIWNDEVAPAFGL